MGPIRSRKIWRNKQVAPADDDLLLEDGEELSADVVDIRELQKTRQHSKHRRGTSRKSNKVSRKQLPGSKEDTGESSLTRSLGGAFTVQTNKLDANKHMMAYIEAEMGKKRKKPTSDSDGDGVGDVKEDGLYQAPSHLQGLSKPTVKEGNVAMATNMLTAIQEVDLGSQSKMANARATDQAVSQMGRSRGTKATDDAVYRRFKKETTN